MIAQIYTDYIYANIFIKEGLDYCVKNGWTFQEEQKLIIYSDYISLKEKSQFE